MANMNYPKGEAKSKVSIIDLIKNGTLPLTEEIKDLNDKDPNEILTEVLKQGAGHFGTIDGKRKFIFTPKKSSKKSPKKSPVESPDVKSPVESSVESPDVESPSLTRPEFFLETAPTDRVKADETISSEKLAQVDPLMQIYREKPKPILSEDEFAFEQKSANLSKLFKEMPMASSKTLEEEGLRVFIGKYDEKNRINFENLGIDLQAIGDKYGFEPNLIRAIVFAESGYNAKTNPSEAGAIGPVQLMPGTAGDLKVNIDDPLDNVKGGMDYLRQQITKIEKQKKNYPHLQEANELDILMLALGAYNAGPAALRRAGYRLPNNKQTQEYIPIVLAEWRRLNDKDTPLFALFKEPDWSSEHDQKLGKILDSSSLNGLLNIEITPSMDRNTFDPDIHLPPTPTEQLEKTFTSEVFNAFASTIVTTSAKDVKASEFSEGVEAGNFIFPKPNLLAGIPAKGDLNPPIFRGEKRARDQFKKEAFEQPLAEVTSAMWASVAKTATLLDNVDKFLSTKTGQTEGNLLELIAEFAQVTSAELAEKGIPGTDKTSQLARYLWGGAGQAAWEIPQIISTHLATGGFGLPVYMAMVAAAESLGKDSISAKEFTIDTLKGGFSGVLLHKVFHGLNAFKVGTRIVPGLAIGGSTSLIEELHKPSDKRDYMKVVADAILFSSFAVLSGKKGQSIRDLRTQYRWAKEKSGLDLATYTDKQRRIAIEGKLKEQMEIAARLIEAEVRYAEGLLHLENDIAKSKQILAKQTKLFTEQKKKLTKDFKGLQAAEVADMQARVKIVNQLGIRIFNTLSSEDFTALKREITGIAEPTKMTRTQLKELTAKLTKEFKARTKEGTLSPIETQNFAELEVDFKRVGDDIVTEVTRIRELIRKEEKASPKGKEEVSPKSDLVEGKEVKAEIEPELLKPVKPRRRKGESAKEFYERNKEYSQKEREYRQKLKVGKEKEESKKEELPAEPEVSKLTENSESLNSKLEELQGKEAAFRADLIDQINTLAKTAFKSKRSFTDFKKQEFNGEGKTAKLSFDQLVQLADKVNSKQFERIKAPILRKKALTLPEETIKEAIREIKVRKDPLKNPELADGVFKQFWRKFISLKGIDSFDADIQARFSKNSIAYETLVLDRYRGNKSYLRTLKKAKDDLTTAMEKDFLANGMKYTQTNIDKVLAQEFSFKFDSQNAPITITGDQLIFIAMAYKTKGRGKATNVWRDLTKERQRTTEKGKAGELFHDGLTLEKTNKTIKLKVKEYYEMLRVIEENPILNATAETWSKFQAEGDLQMQFYQTHLRVGSPRILSIENKNRRLSIRVKGGKDPFNDPGSMRNGLLTSFFKYRIDQQGIFQPKRGNPTKAIIWEHMGARMITYNEAVANFIGRFEIGEKSRSLLENKKFQDTVNERFRNAPEMQQEWIANLQEWMGMKPERVKKHGEALLPLLRGLGTAVLGNNPSVVVAQIPSLFVAGSEIDINLLLTAFGEISSNPKARKTLAIQAMKDVPELWERFSKPGSERIDLTVDPTPLGKAFKPEYPTILGRQFEMFNVKKHAPFTRPWWRAFREAGFAGIESADQLVHLSIFRATQMEAAQLGIKGKAAEQYTANRTAQIMYDTQPTWDQTSASIMLLAGRTDIVARTLSMFGSQRLKNVIILNNSISRFKETRRLNNGQVTKQSLIDLNRSTLSLVTSTAAITLTKMLYYKAITEDEPMPNEEKFLKEYVRNFYKTSLGNHPLGDVVAEMTIAAYDAAIKKDETFYGLQNRIRFGLNPASTMAESIVDVGLQALSALKGGEFEAGPHKGKDKRMQAYLEGVETLLVTMAYLKGMPIVAPLRILERNPTTKKQLFPWKVAPNSRFWQIYADGIKQEDHNKMDFAKDELISRYGGGLVGAKKFATLSSTNPKLKKARAERDTRR